jgi:RimJ/RimL family protein N-acetyltransferase
MDRIHTRHFFPSKYKSRALARGDLYLVDELEEYREDALDYTEKERLRRQRERRMKIGTIVESWFDDGPDGKFHYIVESDTGQGFTPEMHRALCETQRDY